jgi:heme exporter protein B
MFHFKLLFLKELKSSLSLKGSYILSLAFFSITIVILPIGIGPDKNILSLISPGLIWVSLILTSLLSLNSLFHEDYIDGTLDLYKNGPLSFSEIAFVKSLAHWISNFLPLLFITPVLSFLIDLPNKLLIYITLSILIGTPSLSFIGSLGSALTLSLRQHNLLIPLIIFPLFIPTLIFGSGSISSLIFSGFEEIFIRQIYLLIGISGISLVVCPFICSYILDSNYD